MITKIKKIVESKKKCDIVIIGKGSSIDSIDLSLLKNYIVINTNDSEIIFPGDICIYNQEFTNDYLKINNPECKLYFSNFINHNPDLNHFHHRNCPKLNDQQSCHSFYIYHIPGNENHPPLCCQILQLLVFLLHYLRWL